MSRTRRRLAAIVAAAAMAVATLAGCSSQTSASTPTGDSVFQGDSSENYYMVTFLSGYPFWKETYRGFQDAAEQLGVTANYTGTTEYDVNAAVGALDQVITMNPAGIAVTAMDPDAYIDPINRSVDAGIPTVTFDSDSPGSKRAAFLGTGNYAAGAEAARQVGALYDGAAARVGVVTLLGQANVNDRVLGFRETLAAEFPKIQLVDVVDAGSDETSASTSAANLIKANPDLDLIFTTGVSSQVGTLTAIEEAGKTGTIKLVTFDDDQVTLENIKSGKVELSIAQGPYHMGYWSMMMLYATKHSTVNPVDDWAEHGIAPLPPVVDTGAFLINADNVDAYLASRSSE